MDISSIASDTLIHKYSKISNKRGCLFPLFVYIGRFIENAKVPEMSGGEVYNLWLIMHSSILTIHSHEQMYMMMYEQMTV